MTAWDTRTGERRWIFHTVPKPGEYGYETWEDDSAKYSGHAGVWAPMALDAALGYVYLPVEVATSDYYGGHRLGNNLFSSSLVCLNARTGERVWHYQIVHHDIYEYDNSSAPILMDVTLEGRSVKAVVQLTKQSFAFAFDRATGEPLWPIEERPVRASEVPGERASPTQPFPTKPAALDRQGAVEGDLIDLTPAIRDEAREIARRYRLGPLYSPPSLADAADGTRSEYTCLGGRSLESDKDSVPRKKFTPRYTPPAPGPVAVRAKSLYVRLFRFGHGVCLRNLEGGKSDDSSFSNHSDRSDGGS